MKPIPYVMKIAVEAPTYSELAYLIHANLRHGLNNDIYAMEVKIKQRVDGRWMAELSGAERIPGTNATEVYEEALKNTYGDTDDDQ